MRRDEGQGVSPGCLRLEAGVRTGPDRGRASREKAMALPPREHRLWTRDLVGRVHDQVGVGLKERGRNGLLKQRMQLFLRSVRLPRYSGQ